MSRFCSMAVLLVLLLLQNAGCMTSSYGQKIEAAQVNSIQKGVTTRPELEAKFGAPIHTALMPDGRRSLHYTYHESKMKGETLIPFYPGGGADSRQQTLQVILDANNVVQDYEFSDTTGETKVNAFGAGGTTTQRPTSQPVSK